MATEVFELFWRVPKTGYQWVDACLYHRGPGPPPTAPEPERILTDGLIVGRPYEAEHYEPLRDCPGLFRTVAGTPPTEEAIRAFANEYGALGEWSLLYDPATINRANRFLNMAGESLL